MCTILVVEDDPTFADGLRINLEYDGYGTRLMATGLDAVEAIQRERPDLVLLDLRLPDISGFEVLRKIATVPYAPPIIVLSACTDESDRLAAFRLGARDYVSKPFSLLELLARIDLHLTLGRVADHSGGQLLVDCIRREVQYRNTTIDLTPLEFDILRTLAKANGAVVAKAHLLREVWNLPSNWNTRTHEVHLNNLRRKLARHGLVAAIKTVQRQGYRLDTECRVLRDAPS